MPRAHFTTELREGSLASPAGLGAGDLIVEADRHTVASADGLQEVLGKANCKASVLRLVKRKSSTLFVVLPLKSADRGGRSITASAQTTSLSITH